MEDKKLRRLFNAWKKDSYYEKAEIEEGCIVRGVSGNDITYAHLKLSMGGKKLVVTISSDSEPPKCTGYVKKLIIDGQESSGYGIRTLAERGY